MADTFDPDAYLSTKPSAAAPGGFDPDSYLSSKGQVNPITDYSRERVAAGEEANRPGALTRFGEGVLAGGSQVVGNIDRAVAAAGEKVGINTGGAERYQNFKDWEAAHAKDLESGFGTAGKIGGEVLATIPAALLTKNPWIVGGAAGGLTTEAESPLGAARDVGLGAIGGKLGDVAARGLSRGVGALVDKFSPNPILAASPAGATAGRQAAQYVARLMSDAGIVPADLIHAGSATTKPITSAEIIGKNGTTALGALARREGTTGDALDAVMRQRAMDAPTRMLDDYAAASGIDPRAASGDIQAFVDQGRATVKPMFDQALGVANGGKSPAVWNSDLAKLSERPVIRKAMAAVAEDLSNAGKDPTAFGFVAQDPKTGRFVKQPRPTAEAWDMISKRVGSLSERDAFGRILPDTMSPGNFNITTAKRDLTGVLRKSIPGYGDALDASGDYLSVKSSFERGQKFIMDPKTSVDQTVKYLSGLTQPEKEAFKGGIANQLFEASQNGRLSSKLFYRTANGSTAPIPAVKEKLEAALGKSEAAAFLSNIEAEGHMSFAANRMRPGVNSPTAEYTEAMRQQDEPYGVNGHLADFGADVVTRGPRAAVRGQLANAIGKAAAAMKTAGMPPTVRNEAGRLLMMRPEDLGRYLSGAFTNGQPRLEVLRQPAALGVPLIGHAAGVAALPSTDQ